MPKTTNKGAGGKSGRTAKSQNKSTRSTGTSRRGGNKKTRGQTVDKTS